MEACIGALLNCHHQREFESIMRRLTFLIITAIVVLGLVGALTGCGAKASSDTIYTRVSEASLKAGDTIPAPKEDVVLTVTGKIGTTNSDNSIQMDMPTIESAGLVDYTVTDPFEGGKVTFRGPLMSDLLDLWKVPADAT